MTLEPDWPLSWTNIIYIFQLYHINNGVSNRCNFDTKGILIGTLFWFSFSVIDRQREIEGFCGHESWNGSSIFFKVLQEWTTASSRSLLRQLFRFILVFTRSVFQIVGNMTESATPIKLFGKWSLDDVEISDLSLVVSIFYCAASNMFSSYHLNDLQDFIAVKGKHATFVAHTAGRYQRKKFRKAQVRTKILPELFN